MPNPTRNILMLVLFPDAAAIVYASAAPFGLAAILMGLALYLFDVPDIRLACPKPQKGLVAEGE